MEVSYWGRCMTDLAIESTDKADRTLATVAWVSCLLGAWPIGLVIALVDRRNVPDWLATHYSYLIRTIMIGFLYGAVLFVLSFVLAFLLIPFGLVAFPALALWYYVRCVKGLIGVVRGNGIDVPRTWLA